MKAKKYLQQLQRLDTMINQKIKELGDLRLQAQSTGSMDYSKACAVKPFRGCSGCGRAGGMQV